MENSSKKKSGELMKQIINIPFEIDIDGERCNWPDCKGGGYECQLPMGLRPIGLSSDAQRKS